MRLYIFQEFLILSKCSKALLPHQVEDPWGLCRFNICSKSAQRTQHWYSKSWQASHSELPVAVHLVIKSKAFVHLLCLFCRYLSSSPRSIEPLRLIDNYEMKGSRQGFFTVTLWHAEGSKILWGLICFRVSTHVWRLHKPLRFVWNHKPF